MLTWVVYDISKDRTRTKIADRCLDFGLQRVQKSVFLGEIPPNRVEEIIQFSKELLNLETTPCTSSRCAATTSTKCGSSGRGLTRRWWRMKC